MMPVAAMVEPRTVEPRTTIVGVCRAYDAAIANEGIVRLVVISAIVSRRITAVIARVAAIIAVTRTIGVGARRDAADYRSRQKSAGQAWPPSPVPPPCFRRRRCRDGGKAEGRCGGQCQRCFPHGTYSFP